MHRVKSLPAYLRDRYEGWKATSYEDQRAHLRKLALEGQHPRAMVIACCDSRVEVGSVFGQKAGELFVHRNIANLVPPFEPDGRHHGTAAAVEYAVGVLEVSHILVMGHSRCGGVKGCMDMVEGRAPDLESTESFVGRWLDTLRPALARLPEGLAAEDRQRALEKEGVKVSLENLLGYPFVARAVDAGRLTLHGLWSEIAEGEIETYDGSDGRFQSL